MLAVVAGTGLSLSLGGIGMAAGLVGAEAALLGVTAAMAVNLVRQGSRGAEPGCGRGEAHP